ncbi:MAG: peptide-methionine (S)-S-oxide reductase MsrA [Candidatus Thiodiazotropha sp. (ex Lucinoma borealis)]|nr:peptide-methionine (S)-S-oxide reductase MsrA [Candidatus Thiodiazotropha sp. (ex Lucinoma borealis)]MCU7863666.1 peptide-methionine (S)-S-oxide reductase MsrA [Candidatus Thiodiazotropha sp. (ex Lucinoma borealis)]MCU7870179.1 peptide-methionine (S)-S-oxide reductase MsrA [Candidatus Thiodiazotropha sp. (ex Lucinoma borealis)]
MPPVRKITILLLVLLTSIGTVTLFAQAEIKTDNKPPMITDNLAVATFAGGCFWCTESGFEKLRGVTMAISGYTGGQEKEPHYRQVASGATGHLESVRVYYDPMSITYQDLLQAFWRMINPTDSGGQFHDRGHQYSSAIFYHTEKQRKLAESSIAELDSSHRYDKAIVTPILMAGPFYPAEDYHQDYYKHNPLRYNLYRWNSGRDRYLKKVWGDDLIISHNMK